MKLKAGFIWAILGVSLAACTSNAPKDTGPSQSTLYVMKGLQYMETGRLDVAQQDLQKAIELDEHNSEAYNAMGVLMERTDRLDEAVNYFNKAMTLDPNNPSPATNYGRVLCNRGQYEQGLAYIRKAIDNKSYATPWIGMTNAGVCIGQQGQLAEAEAYFRKALEFNPVFPPALLELAKLSYTNGNALSSRAFLERFNAVSAPSAASLALGYQTEKALGNQKDATKYLNKLLRFFPTSKEAQRYR